MVVNSVQPQSILDLLLRRLILCWQRSAREHQLHIHRLRERAAEGFGVAQRARIQGNDFRRRHSAKPRTLNTLLSSIKHLLGEQGTEAAVNRLVGELERLNAIRVTDGKVTYPS